MICTVTEYRVPYHLDLFTRTTSTAPLLTYVYCHVTSSVLAQYTSQDEVEEDEYMSREYLYNY